MLRCPPVATRPDPLFPERTLYRAYAAVGRDLGIFYLLPRTERRGGARADPFVEGEADRAFRVRPSRLRCLPPIYDARDRARGRDSRRGHIQQIGRAHV